MREAARCEKRRSFPEEERSFRDLNTPLGVVDASRRQGPATQAARPALGLRLRSARANAAYQCVFKGLDKHSTSRETRWRLLRRYSFGKLANRNPREWFGISFVTISAPGVGVCSI